MPNSSEPSGPRGNLAGDSPAGLVFRDATALAEDLAAGRLSATEVVQAHIEQIERHNPSVGAVVVPMFEAARARAAKADAAHDAGNSWGPLHGVPVTVKDTYAIAGVPTTVGIPWAEHRPTRTATAVQRLQAAGAIVLGKTNVPLASYDWQCKNPKFGRCNNPYDLGRTPGGSSGGSAAALASGMSALELGSDVAGSIRLPAGFCGVTGLRPTEGAISPAGHGRLPGHPNSLRSLAVCGPMARSVRDLQRVLPLLAEPDPRAPLVPGMRQSGGCTGPLELDGLRLGWTTQLGTVAATESIRTAVQRLAARLGETGATVDAADMDAIDFAEAQRVWGIIQGCELIAVYPPPLRWWPFTWLLRTGVVGLHFGVSEFSRGLAGGFTASRRAYFEALTRRDALIEASEGFLAGLDAWIAPVAPVTAFTHRRTGAALHVDGNAVAYSHALGMYHCPIALLGCPVVVVPIGRDEDGLPIAIQIVGRRWSDMRLLQIAARIEALTGGFEAPAGYD